MTYTQREFLNKDGLESIEVVVREYPDSVSSTELVPYDVRDVEATVSISNGIRCVDIDFSVYGYCNLNTQRGRKATNQQIIDVELKLDRLQSIISDFSAEVRNKMLAIKAQLAALPPIEAEPVKKQKKSLLKKIIGK